MSINKATICRARFFAWLIILFSLASHNAGAQNFFFDNYGVKQGLSEQKVYTVLQDSKDYIWLGTANGLSRFDGRQFVNFTTRDGLSSGGVKCMAEDSLGDIWFGHLNGGLSRYDGHRFETASFDSITLVGDLTSIQQFDSTIWFTSEKDGAIQADFPVKNIMRIDGRQYRGKDKLSDQVFGSTLLRDGTFIAVADAGLRRFNPAERKFEIYRMPHLTTYFTTTCLLEDSRGNIWFGTYNGGLYKYVMSESNMLFFDLIRKGVSSNMVSCLTEDSRGRVWAGTWGGGIAVFDGDSMQIFSRKNGLKASRIYAIKEDVEGNILITDQDNGLTIFKGDAFVNFSGEELLPDPNVNAIFQEKSGFTWFGTNAGISRFLPGSGKKPQIFNGRNNAIFENVRFIKEDRDGNLWIGAKEGGLIKYNMTGSSFESQPEINAILPAVKDVTALEVDQQNNLWIGTVDGVTRGTIGSDNFRRQTLLDSLTVSRITALHCDPSGRMWIGIEPGGDKPGLIAYNPASDRFRPVKALTGIIPKTILMDKRGVLWIGTGEGIFTLRNDSILLSLSHEDGLLSDNINLLIEGDDGSICIGSNNGLNRYLADGNRIFSYTERNGFTGIETRPNAVFRTLSGDLWFGTANGATRLTLSKAETKEREPLTHLRGLQVNNESREMYPGMKLKNNERSLLFDYYSICLTNPDVVRYKVKLEGADEDWRPVTDQTRAIYSALPPGRYTFMVTARNDQGIWNDKPVTYSFIIKPPYYFTWWFILSILGLAVLFIMLYIQIRERSLKREKLILEARVRERTAELIVKNREIEDKNRDITASIRYAERIQRAMLQREDTMLDTFVVFMPKDIVSGDFYWMYENEEWRFIAAVDCTGHGVPGAFMSIIGQNSLNKIVKEYGITRPSAIVDQLNTEVMNALLQRHERAINDGMDLALIAFSKKEFTLQYAGAYNSLYVVREGQTLEYKGDRFPVGMATMDEKKRFSNVPVDVKPGDMLYMCSDGYADQFGHTDGKKYKTGNIKKLLAGIYHLPLREQKDRIEREILEWKGELPQVDDILFIGTRIPGN